MGGHRRRSATSRSEICQERQKIWCMTTTGPITPPLATPAPFRDEALENWWPGARSVNSRFRFVWRQHDAIRYRHEQTVQYGAQDTVQSLRTSFVVPLFRALFPSSVP